MGGKELFAAFTVHIYFAYENILLICSYEQAKKIPYIETILRNRFAEEAITFQYSEDGHIFDGPLVIVSMALTDSILLENGKTLKSHFKSI